MEMEFWKVSQIYRKASAIESTFNKGFCRQLAAWQLISSLTKKLYHSCFPVDFAIFLENFFCNTFRLENMVWRNCGYFFPSNRGCSFLVSLKLQGNYLAFCLAAIRFTEAATRGVLGNFTKSTGKHLRQSHFFNKVAGLGL